MRIGWLTDTHLDKVTSARIDRLAADTRATRPDIVVITGDISEAEPLEGHLRQLAGGLGVPVYFVLGNHDYYGGSIPEVRAAAATFDFATYLPPRGVVRPHPGLALVGVDGWGDGRNGLKAKTGALLNDAFHIAQLRQAHLRDRYHAALAQLGRAEGARLDKLVREAVKVAKTVVVATHVPPFPEAAWFRDAPADPSAQPYFSCKSTGDVLLQCALDFPTHRFLVLCGHSHGGGSFLKCPNLAVRTGAARVANPHPQPAVEFL